MNLLVDPVFTVVRAGTEGRLNLPALLQALGEDRVESLFGLQRHQEDAFHVFLCYLAGAVLAREGRDGPQQTEAFWRDGIRRLTASDGCPDDSAWTLVVEDVTRPAFMQPPLTDSQSFKVFKPKARTPDELDLLPTAKNHDVKSARGGFPAEVDWIFALVSLQTASGFFGQGNYGIARMNGGFGSRPVCATYSVRTLGGRFAEDLVRLLGARDAILDGPWSYAPSGSILLWVLPWDLRSSLPLSKLDPFFTEVSRAVRLKREGGALVAYGSPTKVARIAAKEAKGVLGDPWTPVKVDREAALTVSGAGLTPQLVRDLLFEDGFRLEAMQRSGGTHPGEGCQFYASILVRGQGTTDGFHSVSLPIPGRAARRLFGNPDERERLSALSKRAINDAAVMQARVLKPAFFALVESNQERSGSWWEAVKEAFSYAWSEDYFPWLWRTVEAEDADAARVEWLRSLRDKARGVMEEASGRYPARDGRRYRCRVKADGLFEGTLFKNFPELKEAKHDERGN